MATDQNAHESELAGTSSAMIEVGDVAVAYLALGEASIV